MKPRERKSGSVVILVVDDEPCVLNTVSCILAYAGYEVLYANSAENALRLAKERREPIDLLLTDVILGGLSGPVLAEEFARLHPESRMLFMAGLPDNPEILEQVIGRGRPFLPKPFRAPVLLQAIRTVLEAPHVRSAGGNS